MNECHVAYLEYYATGEGVTTVLAVGSTPEHARLHFNRRAHAYFRDHMTVVPLASAASDPKFATIAKMIPESVRETFARNPPLTTEYYCELHFNLA